MSAHSPHARSAPYRLVAAALAGALGLLAAAPARASEPPRRLSLADAIALAQRRSPDVRAAEAGVAEAQARKRGAAHLWFPKLKVSANLILWNASLPFKIPPMDLSNLEVPDGCFMPDACFALFDQLFQNLDLGMIREQFTAQLSVKLIQPLTPLYSVHRLNRIERLGVDLERAKVDRTRQQVRFEVAEAYIQVFQAGEYVAIMKEADALVQAHLRRIATLLKEEVVRRAEQLKVQVKAAEVQQGLLKAQAARTLAEANLVRLLDLPAGTPLVLTERFADPPPPYPLSLEVCVARALAQRKELRMTRIGAEQARAGRQARLWQLVPTVAAVAQFEANHGMGSIMPKRSVFIGGVLEWEFDWGKTLREADEITAKLRRVEALEQKARAGIPVEVRKFHLDLQVARDSLKVGKAAIAAAEESHRIQVQRFEASAASTTDVLDAQMELTRARAGYTQALYAYYLAAAALDRAMGVE